IVQHMPSAFLGPFAERINKICRITVKIAEDGEPLTPGTFLVGPGGTHLKLNRKGKRSATVHLSPEPSDSLHRPSVNQIFLSVAKTYPSTGLGVIMTGMGNDGLEGAKAMKKANCGIIAQDAASCVVYGMPRAVVDENLTDMIAPLDLLHSIILSAVRR
ncbi:MAG: CheB methylesterase domain-containing protein, partial [Nitrospinota bacterium]